MYGADRGRIAGGRRPVRGDEDEKQQGEGERAAHGVLRGSRGPFVRVRMALQGKRARPAIRTVRFDRTGSRR